MKPATKVHDDTCGCEMCSTGFLEHPRYFPRQMITPVELTLEHDYWRDKMRRHNRLLHGWGVVCGARVCPIPTGKKTDAGELIFEPWKVRIEPGYILGPYGDEIVIDCERVFDIRSKGALSATGESCGEVLDPWCAEVHTTSPPECVYIAVKYQEVRCRPVRVQPIGCGCDDMQCEYSRLRDGYEITALSDCPPSHRGAPSIPYPWPPVHPCSPKEQGRQKERVKEERVERDDMQKEFICLPDCPSCPSDPWVVLAKVCVDESGVVDLIDNCECRRLVMAFGHTWGRCTQEPYACRPHKEEPTPVQEKPRKAVNGEAAGDKGKKPPAK